ncbi:MAG: LysR family transcriptional regulator [Planctomycetia bacterium]|nr:LysR family transcriptional regulator [Planctomycetia bacterium]
MNLKSLKIFCDIVARRSFSRAAEENGISQSAASQVVGQLEARLGVPLIERSKRPLVPTREGQVFFDGCRKIVARYDALEDEVRTLHEEVAGRVRVAAIYSVGLHHMSRYLQEFMSLHPRSTVRLEYVHPHRVLEAVENGDADIGLVSYPRSTRTLEAEPWREEPLVLVCAPGNAFAGRVQVALDELDGRPMVGFDPDLVIRHEIDRSLAARNAEPDVVMAFDNIETIKRAVEIDAGVALLPEPTVGREVAAGTLCVVRIAGDELVRPLGIVHARGKPLAPTVRRFVDLLRGHAHDLDSAAPPPGPPDAAAAAGDETGA